jgi:hypothetical protein
MRNEVPRFERRAASQKLTAPVEARSARVSGPSRSSTPRCRATAPPREPSSRQRRAAPRETYGGASGPTLLGSLRVRASSITTCQMRQAAMTRSSVRSLNRALPVLARRETRTSSRTPRRDKSISASTPGCMPFQRRVREIENTRCRTFGSLRESQLSVDSSIPRRDRSEYRYRQHEPVVEDVCAGRDPDVLRPHMWERQHQSRDAHPAERMDYVPSVGVQVLAGEENGCQHSREQHRRPRPIFIQAANRYMSATSGRIVISPSPRS